MQTGGLTHLVKQMMCCRSFKVDSTQCSVHVLASYGQGPALTLTIFMYTASSGCSRTTSSFRRLSRSVFMSAAGGLNWIRISALRSFSALPAFRMKGTPCHLQLAYSKL